MSLVGKVKHLRRHAHHLQRVEKLEAFADVEPVVQLPVDDQRRRLEIAGRIARRPLLIHRRVAVRSPFELPVIEPEFFGRSPGRFGIEHAVVRHDALETVGMPKHPVRHVSAVASAQSALAVFVDERISLLRVVQPLHQIFKWSAAPIPVDRVNELLPVSSRAVEVDHDNHVSVGGEKFRIPAIRPVVSPSPLRAAVDEELHRIFLGSIKVRWLDEETFDLVALRAREPERFKRRHGDFREHAVVQMSKSSRLRQCAIRGLRRCREPRRTKPVFDAILTSQERSARDIDLARAADRHPRKQNCPSAVDNRKVIVVPGSDFADLSVVHPDLVDRRFAGFFGSKINDFRTRIPGDRAHPAIKVRCQTLLLPRLPVKQHQPKAVAFVSRTLLGAVGDVLAIGRIERSRVAGGIVGGDVLGLDRSGRTSIHRNDPQIVIGGSSFDLVVIRGVANLLPVGRESVVVLPAQREHRSIVITRREIAGKGDRGGALRLGSTIRQFVSRRRSRDDENVAALAHFEGVPMAIQKPVEDQRLNFGLPRRFHLVRVAGGLFLGCAVAFRINIRGEQNVLAIRRPEFAARFGGDRSQLVDSSNGTGSAIEIGNPNLRAAVFVREKRKPLPIRSPARTIAILIGDEHALLSSRALLDGRDARRSVIIRIQRHDPDVRRLRIRGQIHVDRAKQHPFPIRRRHRLADPLQLHHVFKSEGMFGLRECRKRKKQNEKKNQTSHSVSPKQKSVAERSEVRGQIVSEAIEEVRGQIAEVKKSERERHCEPRGSNLCNLTSNL